MYAYMHINTTSVLYPWSYQRRHKKKGTLLKPTEAANEFLTVQQYSSNKKQIFIMNNNMEK